MKLLRVFLLVNVCIVSLISCGGGGGETNTPTLSSVTINTPIQSSIIAGQSLSLTATAVNSDQSKKDITFDAVWDSTKPDIASVNAAGIVTAKLAGSVIISISYQGFVHNFVLFIVSAPNSKISIANVAMVEGDNGVNNFIFTVSLDAPSTKDINVDYKTVDGTAIAGSVLSGGDYISVPTTTLTFPVGSTSKEITVMVFGDVDIEIDETFSVTLSNPINATLGTSKTAIGTIVNDDSIPLEVSIANTSVIEGDVNTRNLVFTVSLNSSAPSNVDIGYATANGTAIADISAITGDYIAVPAATLTILSGSTSATINIVVHGDTDIEPNETLTVTLSNPINVNLSSDIVATGTILDDDAIFSLNDTGIIECSNNNSSLLTTCPQNNAPGQDAEQGRDATHNDDSDGHAGFSFTQIDATGMPLATASTDYSVIPWSCVVDNVTGLMWEIKTKDVGLQDTVHRYTWYNSSGINDGGNTGTENGNSGFDTGSCVDTVNCDTEKFVAQINTAALCGHSDWRLPDLEELRSIVDLNFSTTVDNNYFPNTTTFLNKKYWSSTQNSSDSGGTSVYTIAFTSGSSSIHSKNEGFSIRLVRRVQ